MIKRLVEIDDQLLERARSVTHAPSIRAAVEAGLRRLVDDAAVADHVRWLRAGEGLDPDRAGEARAPRTPAGG